MTDTKQELSSTAKAAFKRIVSEAQQQGRFDDIRIGEVLRDAGVTEEETYNVMQLLRHIKV